MLTRFLAGKTTLIASFYNRKFIDKYEPTIFDTFSIQTEIYKRQVNLEICDSAGQEEFSRVRPLSYPEVDAIILVSIRVSINVSFMTRTHFH